MVSNSIPPVNNDTKEESMAFKVKGRHDRQLTNKREGSRQGTFTE